MPYFNTFVTTNWDRYFENICKAKPFDYDSDLRFWELPSRRVLKIHGTIDDYSSIVATREDYTKCAKRLQTSLIGGKLKEILSTKTCIFIGYSMKDDDFREIFQFVKEAQGQFRKSHYIVSPFIYKKLPFDDLIPIKTDGTFFLKTIKDHMCNSFDFLPDSVFALAQEELFSPIPQMEPHIDDMMA